MDPIDLEHLIDRALKTTGTPRAPETLLPAVMAVVRAAAARPWYARPWTTWPRAWQVVSTALMLALMVALYLIPALPPRSVPGLDVVRPIVHSTAAVVTDVETLVGAVEVVRRVIAQSVIGIGLVLVALMLMTSVAAGAVLGRVVIGGQQS
jgi:hypothetical protein